MEEYEIGKFNIIMLILMIVAIVFGILTAYMMYLFATA